MYLVLILFYVTYSLTNNVPEVHIKLGKISGYHKSSVNGRTFSAFEGIPYAQPPLGDLRFEAPQPISPWNTTLNATTLYVCKQMKSIYSILDRYKNEHEDCLYLNVYVPNQQPTENDNFDVIVNIHPGAFQCGDAALASPVYIMDRNIVYVNVNYRLGILGFLSTEDAFIPGNNGLKDQQLALRWIQAHIKKFGGNPKSVTLVGESAGGAFVHFHYLSPKSWGLFHRGISISGNALMPWAIQKDALGKSKKLAALLNCAYTTRKEMIDCLKVIPVDEIISSSSNFYIIPNHPVTPFGPVVESKSEHSFITEHPYRLLEEGRINHVPWLSLIAGNEGAMFTTIFYLPGSLEEMDENWDELFPYISFLGEGDNTKVAQKIKYFYFQNESLSQSNFYKYEKLIGDRCFNVGFETAVTMQANVSKSSVYAGVYNYSAAAISYGKVLGFDVKVVTHGDCTVLIFGFPFEMNASDRKLSKSDELMKNMLLDCLTSFASDGKPRTKEVSWEPVTTDTFKCLLIRDVDDMNMEENIELSPRKFWKDLFEKYSATLM
ncbi:hypothetical protein RI129_000428 [Pyrocoelia pectoralis]|uniref:Carboxylic ester hydrolase n=1 Tax=Pyrocoelia pectoralis TaxID=417401 RepID=A0AAN7VTY2_9COLE